MAMVKRLQHASVPMRSDGAAAARSFYGDALGMTEIEQRPAGLAHLNLVWFRAGDGGDEIHCFAADDGPNTPGQHVCLEVDDLDAYRQRFEALGIAVHETEEIYNRPRFFVIDPFENRIEITQILGDFK